MNSKLKRKDPTRTADSLRPMIHQELMLPFTTEVLGDREALWLERANDSTKSALQHV